MGNNSSKPETKVFTPNTPIDFSSSFLAQLESSAEVCIEKQLNSQGLVIYRYNTNQRL